MQAIKTQQKNSQQSAQKSERKKTVNKDQKRLKAPIFQNIHVTRVIKKVKNSENYECLSCPGSEFTFKGIRKHLLSKTHQGNVKDDDEGFKMLLRTLSKSLDESLNSDDNDCQNDFDQSQKRDKDQQKEKRKEKEGYLQYIHLCAALNLSIQQISQLTRELKTLFQQNKLDFLLKNNFDPEEISNVINCFGAFYQEKLKEYLSESKYSVSIDNACISKTNICAIKARFLRDIPKTDMEPIPRIVIENKLIGLKYLNDSSSGQVIFKALKEKVFDLGFYVENNFAGITFDHAKVMIGEKNGLLGQIKKHFDQKYIFSIGDPCHALNLAVKKSLNSLPNDIKDFIDDLHNHFISPQRTAALLKIQEANSMPRKGLCHYVKTRWLSLGFSLSRILQIWESLTLYMENKPKGSALKKFDNEKYFNLLKDPMFKLKIIFFNAVVKRINNTSIRYQSQKLEIQELYNEMKSCIRDLAEIITSAQNIPDDLSKIPNLDWDAEGFVREDSDLIQKMIQELDAELYRSNELAETTIKEKNVKKDFLQFCRNYLKEIVIKLSEELAVNNELLKTFDFVTLSLEIEDLKQKIVSFNDSFQLIDQNNIPELMKEINTLYTKNMQWARSDSALQFWAWIESTFNKFDLKTKKTVEMFPNLALFMRTAHVLPTSSSSVEQSFSMLKLIKSSIRSQLKEETVQSLC